MNTKNIIFSLLAMVCMGMGMMQAAAPERPFSAVIAAGPMPELPGIATIRLPMAGIIDEYGVPRVDCELCEETVVVTPVGESEACHHAICPKCLIVNYLSRITQAADGKASPEHMLVRDALTEAWAMLNDEALRDDQLVYDVMLVAVNMDATIVNQRQTAAANAAAANAAATALVAALRDSLGVAPGAGFNIGAIRRIGRARVRQLKTAAEQVCRTDIQTSGSWHYQDSCEECVQCKAEGRDGGGLSYKIRGDVINAMNSYLLRNPTGIRYLALARAQQLAMITKVERVMIDGAPQVMYTEQAVCRLGNAEMPARDGRIDPATGQIALVWDIAQIPMTMNEIFEGINLIQREVRVVPVVPPGRGGLAVEMGPPGGDVVYGVMDAGMPGYWQCVRCGVHNGLLMWICDMCCDEGFEIHKPLEAAAAAVPPVHGGAYGGAGYDAGAVAAVHGAMGHHGGGFGHHPVPVHHLAAPAHWVCPGCTYENPPGAAACDLCGTARP